MLKYLSIGAILQALVIQQTIAWGVLTNQPLFTTPTGERILVDTLKQRLQFFRKNNFSGNQNYNEDIMPGDKCQYTNLDAKKVVDSIKSAIHFYEDYFQLAVRQMDSAMGLLTLKGNMFHAKNIIEKTENYPDFSKQLNVLFEKSSKLSNTILELSRKRTARGGVIAKGLESYLKGNNTDLWSGPIGAWKSFDIIPKYTHQFSAIGDEIETIDNDASYTCLSKLLNNCDVPSDCQHMYLENITHSQYMLTHKILYLHLAEGKSCMTKEENVGKFKDWEKFQETLCGKVYQEARFIAKNGFPAVFRDLFGKQITFCGIAGFPNFMRLDWLNEVLSWQSKGAHGCFKDIYGDIKASDEKVNITTNITSGENFEESCLIHFTSVSLSALATYFRHMFDTCSPDIFKNVLY